MGLVSRFSLFRSFVCFGVCIVKLVSGIRLFRGLVYFGLNLLWGLGCLVLGLCWA